MKEFFKKASIYIALMLLIAALIFSLNYYYGQKISEDVEAEIAKIAEENNYQLRLLEVETNPLLQEMQIQNLNLIKADQFNLIINLAEINFSWQQVLNYIRHQSFELDKNFESEIKQINYSNLQDNYQLNFSEAEVNYQGDFAEEKLGQIKNLHDLQLLMDSDHNLDLRAAELKYDFPYYRSYGLNNENWNRLSTFDDFIMSARYKQETKKLSIEEFNLSGELLKLIFNLDSVLNYNQQTEKIIFTELKGDYDFLLAADTLAFEANSYFEELNLNQLDFNGSLDLVSKENELQANQLDFNLHLSDFKLRLAEFLNQQLNQNSYGILAAENSFEILIDNFTYQQQYSYPNGSSSSDLDSSLVTAELEAEYNYNQEIPYISSGNLRYKPQTARAEQLNSFLQLVLGRRLDQDEEGYYQLKFWGAVDDLNFE